MESDNYRISSWAPSGVDINSNIRGMALNVAPPVENAPIIKTEREDGDTEVLDLSLKRTDSEREQRREIGTIMFSVNSVLASDSQNNNKTDVNRNNQHAISQPLITMASKDVNSDKNVLAIGSPIEVVIKQENDLDTSVRNPGTDNVNVTHKTQKSKRPPAKNVGAIINFLKERKKGLESGEKSVIPPKNTTVQVTENGIEIKSEPMDDNELPQPEGSTTEYVTAAEKPNPEISTLNVKRARRKPTNPQRKSRVGENSFTSSMDANLATPKPHNAPGNGGSIARLTEHSEGHDQGQGQHVLSEDSSDLDIGDVLKLVESIKAKKKSKKKRIPKEYRAKRITSKKASKKSKASPKGWKTTKNKTLGEVTEAPVDRLASVTVKENLNVTTEASAKRSHTAEIKAVQKAQEIHNVISIKVSKRKRKIKKIVDKVSENSRMTDMNVTNATHKEFAKTYPALKVKLKLPKGKTGHKKERERTATNESKLLTNSKTNGGSETLIQPKQIKEKKHGSKKPKSKGKSRKKAKISSEVVLTDLELKSEELNCPEPLVVSVNEVQNMEGYPTETDSESFAEPIETIPRKEKLRGKPKKSRSGRKKKTKIVAKVSKVKKQTQGTTGEIKDVIKNCKTTEKDSETEALIDVPTDVKCTLNEVIQSVAQCKNCNQGFSSIKHFLEHEANCPKQLAYKCMICNETFKYKNWLVTHMDTHYSGEIHHCKYCSRAFANVYNCKRHEAHHKNGNAVLCTICSKSFKSKLACEIHERVHKFKNLTYPHECEVCRKVLPNPSSYTRHEKIHWDIKPHKCRFCERRFTEKQNCKTHERRHLNERPFSCAHCPAKFFSAGEKIVHEKIHSGQKNYQCKTCGMKFRTDSILRSHLVVHTEDRPFKCAHCDKAFKRKKDCEVHTQTHFGIKPFPCPVCNKSFSSVGNLNQHKRLHEPKESSSLQCRYCGRHFRWHHSLSLHEESHRKKNLQCCVCGEQLPNRKFLNLHELTHVSGQDRVTDDGTQQTDSDNTSEHEDNIKHQTKDTVKKDAAKVLNNNDELTDEDVPNQKRDSKSPKADAKRSPTKRRRVSDRSVNTTPKRQKRKSSENSSKRNSSDFDESKINDAVTVKGGATVLES